MDKKTYEAVKRLVGYSKCFHADNVDKDIEQVEGWIDEVSKDYEGEN